MGILTIAPAELAGAHLLIELAGGPSSGKTLTALRLARGIAGPQGKIGFLDTEASRGRFYAKSVQGGFYHADLTPPFTAKRYRQAISEFLAAGISVLVVDSWSHIWAGEGGVLDQADATGKEGLLKWRTPKMEYNRLVNFLLSVRLHIIMCSRARRPVKQEGKGRDAELIELPWEPIHDKRLKFEMTIFLPMLLNGSYETEPGRLKCPGDLRHLFGGELLTEATGAAIGDWVAGGEPVKPAHELLRGRAYDAAALGGDALSAFWKGLSEDDRAVVTPIGANLRSAAQAADEQADLQREAVAERAARVTDEDALVDPFGHSDIREPAAPADPPAQTTAAAPPQATPPAAVVPSFAEIEPQKSKGGGFDWAGYAAAVLAAYRDVEAANRQAFRAAQSQYLTLLRHANRDASTELSMQMADVDHGAVPAPAHRGV